VAIAWISPGAPRMQAAAQAGTPPQLAARNIFVRADSLSITRVCGSSVRRWTRCSEMKLYAARGGDFDDPGALRPIAGFGSPQHAAEQFWRAYPHSAAEWGAGANVPV
jgi:hypothetical protein